uniref:(northern house mosquito) hypothetical protein n=1 Tax=Culex pipiens TaxID=7175 RepID=A0A8D8I276_CULPI
MDRVRADPGGHLPGGTGLRRRSKGGQRQPEEAQGEETQGQNRRQGDHLQPGHAEHVRRLLQSPRRIHRRGAHPRAAAHVRQREGSLRASVRAVCGPVDATADGLLGL